MGKHTEKSLNELTVPQLKKICKSKKLTVSGKKDVLIEKILFGEPDKEPQSKKAVVLDQNLVTKSISVKNGVIVFEVAGRVHVQMNDEKVQYMGMTVGTPLKVKL